MTIKEALEATIMRMNAISVPVQFTQQIGIPLAECVQVLQVCAKSIKEETDVSKQEQAEEPRQESEENVIDLGVLDLGSEEPAE